MNDNEYRKAVVDVEQYLRDFIEIHDNNVERMNGRIEALEAMVADQSSIIDELAQVIIRHITPVT